MTEIGPGKGKKEPQQLRPLLVQTPTAVHTDSASPYTADLVVSYGTSGLSSGFAHLLRLETPLKSCRWTDV